MDTMRVMRDALVSGSLASVGSTIALALAARAEGKAALRPINATSHWLHGDGAARHEAFDGAHTGVGYATNHAACLFWAFFFELWLAGRRRRGTPAMLQDAVVMSAVAAAVDYGPTPKRFTPGWELVLSRKGMAVAYGGLALGLAAGALLTQSRR
ncbi:MAG: hypothetical protein ACRYGM_15155 [Janthinobacterium lividum]